MALRERRDRRLLTHTTWQWEEVVEGTRWLWRHTRLHEERLRRTPELVARWAEAAYLRARTSRLEPDVDAPASAHQQRRPAALEAKSSQIK